MQSTTPRQSARWAASIPRNLFLALLMVNCADRARPRKFALAPLDDAPPPPLNSIAGENARNDGVVPRTRWDRERYFEEPSVGSVEGFSTEFSVAPGDTLGFKIKTPVGSTSYRYEIYRLGWYGGAGARQVWPPCDVVAPDACPRITIVDNPTQERCNRYGGGVTGLDVPDCANWVVAPDPNASWHVDADAVSGVYVARLSSVSDPDDVSHVPFVVREAPAGPRADVLYQLADSTWQAYNNYNDDGVPLSYYANDGQPRQAVSYNRPWRNRAGGVLHGSKHFLFDLDLPLIRFLEANGVSVAYLGSADLETWAPQSPLDASNPLFGRSVYLANGHEEYWPGRRRQMVETAAAAGTSMLFLCANTAYYKTRFESDTASVPHRVQIAYKEGHSQDDPLKDDAEWTGVYRDTRPNVWDPTVRPWNRPVDAPAGSSNSLTGVTPAAVNLVEEGGQPGNVPPMTVPASMKGLRLWRSSACAQKPGTCTLGVANVGFEMDLRADRYSQPFVDTQPAGLFSVAATILDLTDDGLHVGGGHGYTVAPFADVADYTLPHVTVEATVYRNTAHALVFATSSFRWSHGLDDARSSGADPAGVSRVMQQATINLLADMNVQPATLMPELVAASPSTDATAPTSEIAEVNPAAGIVSGVASDADGVIAGVELSFDDGRSWRGAALTLAGPATSWSFTSVVPAHANPLVRAVDDSGNLEVAHGPPTVIPDSDGLAVTTVGVAGIRNVGGLLTQQIPRGPGGVRSLAPGWTSLVPMDLNGDPLTDLLSYNSRTGDAIFEVAVAGSPGSRVVVNTVAAAPGWTSVVPMNIHGELAPDIADLLSYNATTGLAYYSVGRAPGMQEIVGGAVQAAPGFTSIVPMSIDGDALTDLVWYNAATGLAVYTKGVYGGDGYRQDVIAVRDAAPGWTSIVPMRINGDNLTDFVSYNAATGKTVYSIGDGVSQTILRTVEAAPGWTSIVPFDLNGDDRTDALSYNAATGLAFYSVATAGGVQQVVGPAAHGAAGWTSIAPMKITPDPKGSVRGLVDLLFYR